MKIKIRFAAPIVEAEVTPELLAASFCEMSDKEQAAFFRHVNFIADSWGPAGSTFQFHAIGRELKDNNGRHVIDEIHGALHEDEV